jgi:hypothetical protein
MKMNSRVFLITLLVLLVGVGTASGQGRSEATNKGAMLVSGAVAFSSQGGDLYGEDDRLTTIAIAPSLFYFVVPGLGIGGDFTLSRLSRGDASATTWGFGPKIGYFFDSGSSVIPFVEGGGSYLSIAYSEGEEDESEGGLRFKLGGGLLIRKDHMAVSIEAAYILDRFKFEGADDATTGNTILISVGFGGFLY